MTATFVALLFMSNLPIGAVTRVNHNANQMGIQLAAVPGVGTAQVGEFSVSPGVHVFVNARPSICFTFTEPGVAPTLIRLRERATGTTYTKSVWIQAGLDMLLESDLLEYQVLTTTEVVRHTCPT